MLPHMHAANSHAPAALPFMIFGIGRLLASKTVRYLSEHMRRQEASCCAVGMCLSSQANALPNGTQLWRTSTRFSIYCIRALATCTCRKWSHSTSGTILPRSSSSSLSLATCQESMCTFHHRLVTCDCPEQRACPCTSGRHFANRDLIFCVQLDSEFRQLSYFQVSDRPHATSVQAECGPSVQAFMCSVVCVRVCAVI